MSDTYVPVLPPGYPGDPEHNAISMVAEHHGGEAVGRLRSGAHITQDAADSAFRAMPLYIPARYEMTGTAQPGAYQSLSLDYTSVNQRYSGGPYELHLVKGNEGISSFPSKLDGRGPLRMQFQFRGNPLDKQGNQRRAHQISWIVPQKLEARQFKVRVWGKDSLYWALPVEVPDGIVEKIQSVQPGEFDMFVGFRGLGTTAAAYIVLASERRNQV